MNRRDALKYTALSLGYALSATTTAAILQGCQADNSLDWSPMTFSVEQAAWVGAFADTLIPTTDTPGATDVNAHRFLDELLTRWATAEEREKYLAGMTALQAQCTEETGKSLPELNEEARTNWMSTFNESMLNSKGKPSEAQRCFRRMKGDLIAAYFTSEEIGTEVLAYDPIPGSYDGCIPLEDVGKVWSLS